LRHTRVHTFFLPYFHIVAMLLLPTRIIVFIGHFCTQMVFLIRKKNILVVLLLHFAYVLLFLVFRIVAMLLLRCCRTACGGGSIVRYQKYFSDGLGVHTFFLPSFHIVAMLLLPTLWRSVAASAAAAAALLLVLPQYSLNVCMYSDNCVSWSFCGAAALLPYIMLDMICVSITLKLVRVYIFLYRQ